MGMNISALPFTFGFVCYPLGPAGRGRKWPFLVELRVTVASSNADKSAILPLTVLVGRRQTAELSLLVLVGKETRSR